MRLSRRLMLVAPAAFVLLWSTGFVVAREGVRFTRAYTTWPVCTPARGSMWSGTYPHKHKLIDNVYGVDDAFATMAGAS